MHLESDMNEGELWEEECVSILRDNGYMAGVMPKDASGGQPFDVWAISKTCGLMVECKVTHSGRLDLSRMKDNQIASMRLSCDLGCTGEVWIKSIKHGESTRWRIPWKDVLGAIDRGQGSICISDGLNPLESPF